MPKSFIVFFSHIGRKSPLPLWPLYFSWQGDKKKDLSTICSPFQGNKSGSTLKDWLFAISSKLYDGFYQESISFALIWVFMLSNTYFLFSSLSNLFLFYIFVLLDGRKSRVIDSSFFFSANYLLDSRDVNVSWLYSEK